MAGEEGGIERLKMHYIACRQALMEAMAGGGDAGAPPAAPETSAAPAAAPAAPVMKSEKVPAGNGGNGAAIKPLKKSEPAPLAKEH